MEYVFRGTVYNVVDGDTVDAELDLGFKIKIKQRLRLADIDTPERGQPGYEEARTALASYVKDKNFNISTQKQSKWGYYLAHIEREDGYTINRMMIDEGYAKHYSGGTKNAGT